MRVMNEMWLIMIYNNQLTPNHIFKVILVRYSSVAVDIKLIIYVAKVRFLRFKMHGNRIFLGSQRSSKPQFFRIPVFWLINECPYSLNFPSIFFQPIQPCY